MQKKILTTYSKEDQIEFIIDDDPEFNWIGSLDLDKTERLFIVIDKNVKQIWGEKIISQLRKNGREIFLFEVEPVEESKSILFYPKLVQFLEDQKCGLSDLVLAVGGGIIIDLVSFTCSTYMRGLPFYVIGTTLIGQIDASSAGKTCLNTPRVKNLLGTFYYPKKVYNNVHFLKTCSDYYSRQGWSEIFKYGLLESERLLDDIENYFKNPDVKKLMEIIETTINIRVNVRKRNPLASNLGHTFGHAIEKISDHTILHGDAITMGTVLSLYFAKKVGLTDDATIDNIINRMNNLRLNTFIDKEKIDPELMIELMMRDKKSSSKDLNLVLITGIAKPYENEGNFFYRADPEFVKSFLKDFLENYSPEFANSQKF